MRRSAKKIGGTYVLSMMDHLHNPIYPFDSFLISQQISSHCRTVDRSIGIFGTPEMLHSDQGPEVENNILVKQLQILNYSKEDPHDPIWVIRFQNEYVCNHARNACHA